MHFFTQRGTPTQRTNNLDGNILGSRRGGSLRRRLTPPTAALLWVWIGISALVVPGAWSFLSEDQEEMLVELHNHYRGQVSPTASAMMPLRWDPSLKVIAEGYAAKCVWNHNPELEETGENLYAGTGVLDLREAMEKWFLERLDYDYQNNSCDEEKMCGHYTQMVWADTHRVGCAFHLCNNMEGLDWERVSYLVCNYYPAGNYEDERPYVEGDWCSSCPENLQKCENNLCVADTEDEEEEDEGEGEGEEGEGEDGGEIEEGTVVPPAATSEPETEPEPEPDQDTNPSVQTEMGQERDEDEVLLPAATTTEPFDDLATTSSLDLDLDSAEITTPEPNTHTPNTPTPSPGEGDESEEIEEIEIPTDKPVVTKKGREMAGNILREVAQAGAGSMFVPSMLLLVCLTGILTLRL